MKDTFPKRHAHLRELIGLLGQMVDVHIDRPLGSIHPRMATLKYALNYGYVPGTLAPDGDPIDAYVIGIDGPIDRFRGRCIAVIERLDDEEGKLVIATGELCFSDQEIIAATYFQERFFDVCLHSIPS